MKETWPVAVGLLLGIAAGGFSVWADVSAASPSRPKIAASLVTLLSVIALGALKLAQSRYKDARDDSRDCPDDLRGCVHVIHRAVAAAKAVEAPAEGWLRVTVYGVNDAFLEQLVNYVGGDEANPARAAGRRFSLRYGLIGKVARLGAMRAFDRRKDMAFEQWVAYLVEETGMDHAEAQRTRPDRFAFLGVPIKGPDDAVRAVVYLDAGEPGFFDEETASLVAGCCVGLAKWIDERYYRHR